MVLEDPRPRRTRRWLWPLILIVLVAGGLWILARGNDPAGTVEHLEDLRAASLEISRTASVVNDTLANLGSTDRDEFQVVMSNGTETLAEAKETLAAAAEDPQMGSVMLFYDAAVDQWIIGLTSLEEGVLNVADFPGNSAGREGILSGAQQLRLGDISYAAAAGALEDEITPEPIGTVPTIRFTPEDLSVTDLTGIYETAAAAENSPLGLLPSVSVAQVVTIPAMVTDPAGIGVIPYTDTVTVQVVVANEGNSPSVSATLELRITATVGPLEPLISEVPVLESGENTTIEFTDIAVSPDTVYELAVVLSGLDGADLDPDDNSVVIQFRVNPETPTTTTTTPSEDETGDE